jgi:prepilin-type N-terminal cleavage/methylation domain-containing protein
MLDVKKPLKTGFTLIELVIAMAMMTVIALSMANLNSTLLEQRESAKAKTYIQGVMNRFLTQLKTEFNYASTFTVENPTPDESILKLQMPELEGRPPSQVEYTYINFAMVRTQSNSLDPDPPLNFATITVLDNYLEPIIGFTCGDATTAPVTPCFEKQVEADRGEAVKLAKITVETQTPINRQTLITRAFGELGVTATDVYIFKPIGMLIP